jgi:chloride channel protein, CIC family
MQLKSIPKYLQVLGVRYYRHHKPSETQILILLSFVVGISTGLGAVVFIRLIEYAKEFFFGYSLSYLNQFVINWNLWIPLIPMVGGLIVGPIVYKYAREARGHGVPEVMESVALRGGIIRPRVAIAKSIASAVCIGSGGSAGREGPIVQIGSTIGSMIGQLFRMSGPRVKILVGCGAAAGISAVFNAPIAGVIFALEVILGDFGVRTFSPVILSSVIASVISRSLLGDNPAFNVSDEFTLVSAYEIPIYILLGAFTAVVGKGFTQVLYFTEDLFEKIKTPGFIKPAIGGLLLGFVGLFLPQVFADGYDTIELALEGGIPFLLIGVLILAKILATSLTLGSGNSGGIFAPSLFMGAVAGGFFGIAVNYFFPDVTASSGAYALVGMAGVVAGATHAPITAILIIFEMTGDYNMILPLMLTCVFATLISNKLNPESIYTLKLSRRGVRLRSGKDIEVLSSITVKEVMHTDVESVPHNMPLPTLMKVFEESRYDHFPVIADNGELLGTLSFQDLRSIITRTELDNLVIAADICHTHPSMILPEDTLEEALKKIATRDLNVVPVVADDSGRKLAGILIKGDIYTAYNKKVLEKISKP